MTEQWNGPFGGVLGELVRHLAVRLELRVDARGWDAPSTLWELALDDVPDGLAAALRAEMDSGGTGTIVGENVRIVEPGDETLALALDGLSFVVGVSLVGAIDGHPVDHLVGRRASADCVGAALCTEGWAWPEAVRAEMAAGGGPPSGVPSQHPDRTSVRVLQVVLCDATSVLVQREQDTGRVEVSVHVAGSLHAPRGSVVEALRRYVGVATLTEVPMSARSAARLTWLEQALVLVRQPDVANAALVGADISVVLSEHLMVLAGGAAALVALADPVSLLSAAVPTAGLAALFGGSRHGLSSFVAPVIGDPATDPAPGSAEDLVEWEQVRVAQLAHIAQLGPVVERLGAATRSLGGRPLWQVHEDLTHLEALASWADASLWAAESVSVVRAELLSHAVELISGGELDELPATALLRGGGLPDDVVVDTLVAARIAATHPGPSDVCPCGTSATFEVCHGRVEDHPG